jgi:integrase
LPKQLWVGPRLWPYDALAAIAPNLSLRIAVRPFNLNKLVRWPAIVTAMGVPGLHFHDLRHTGNTLAAKTGASLRDLMARMGHDSQAAAMIYQHATSAADRAIAAAFDKAVREDAQDDGYDPGDATGGVPARSR